MATSRILPVLLSLASCTFCDARRIQISDAGRFDFELESADILEPPPDGLSGIVHAGGGEYFVASDASAYLHRLAVKLDGSTGAVISVRATGGLQLRARDGTPLAGDERKDREDLAMGSDGGQLIIANERCGPAPPVPCIEIHDVETGRLLKRAGPDDDTQLAVFRQAEVNMGFEAIAAMPQHGGYWVATERALAIDGGAATVEAGSAVRLQRLSPELAGTGQFVYVTDKISGPIRESEPLARFAGSRLVSMIALPEGTLLALENIFQGAAGGAPETRIRLYEIGLTGATDVSVSAFAGGLRGKSYQPAAKRLLIELVFPGTASNYEGMALGPRLENGDYAVLLIRDNGAGADQTLHALRLRGKE